MIVSVLPLQRLSPVIVNGVKVESKRGC